MTSPISGANGGSGISIGSVATTQPSPAIQKKAGKQTEAVVSTLIEGATGESTNKGGSNPETSGKTLNITA